MVAKVRTIRTFLETDGQFEAFRGDLKGRALPEDVLAKIYYKNFQRHAGGQPKPVDVPATLKLCDEAAELATSAGAESDTISELNEIKQRLEALAG